MAALTSIKNIGPAFETALIAVGFTSAEQLREIGAAAAYAKLLGGGSVLHMALQGRPCNDCKGEEKKALRKQFDKIKAQSFDENRSELEAFMNQIGVIAVEKKKIPFT